MKWSLDRKQGTVIQLHSEQAEHSNNICSLHHFSLLVFQFAVKVMLGGISRQLRLALMMTECIYVEHSVSTHGSKPACFSRPLLLGSLHLFFVEFSSN